jgi:hypothetical protein
MPRRSARRRWTHSSARVGPAAEEGTPLSPALAERLRTTLDAIGTHGSAAARPRAWRLQEDLDPPGFAAFAALVAASAGGAQSRRRRRRQCRCSSGQRPIRAWRRPREARQTPRPGPPPAGCRLGGGRRRRRALRRLTWRNPGGWNPSAR